MWVFNHGIYDHDIIINIRGKKFPFFIIANILGENNGNHLHMESYIS